MSAAVSPYFANNSSGLPDSANVSLMPTKRMGTGCCLAADIATALPSPPCRRCSSATTMRPVSFAAASTAATLSSPDGSWAEISLDAAGRVAEAGPTALWAAVEQAYGVWRDLGEPDWPRLGLTVRQATQYVWLDEPDGEHTWTLL